MAMATATAIATAIPVGNTGLTSRSNYPSSPAPLHRLCATSCASLLKQRGVLLPQWQWLWQLRMHCCPMSSTHGNWALVSPGSRLRATGVARTIIDGQAQEQTTAVRVKEFLEDLKPIGRTRLIVNTGVAVLESTVTNLDKLFYHVMPGRGEYANLMMTEENVDFHLLIDKVASAKLETGKSMRGNIPTYMIRFMDNSGAVAVSLLVMWKPGSNGDFDDGQVEAYQNLVEKYGSDITFATNSSQ